MKQGDYISIIHSPVLSTLRLDSLIGTTAKILEVKENMKGIRGCWVELPEKYLGEKEWYIPYNSIKT